ncbi:hypothetical protein SAMN04488007_3484 [Maribacter aquivivus]|uniref:Ribbon-helix-helix protein, copG family n=1 Tax=Maribacter aquivivus TaxID=228958 RepID=A0A1M6U4R3_9FLAO|nr:hypothetical protein [Maribacter aquivivus]SHK64153.1 hypothetical protein SAMN04488007_3484 [Maribacter aquivivus]
MSKNEFYSLIAKAQASKPNTSIQKVVPEISITKNEKQFSFYIDKTILRKLKTKALEEDRSVKSIINESIHNYLNQ